MPPKPKILPTQTLPLVALKSLKTNTAPIGTLYKQVCCVKTKNNKAWWAWIK
ncbi:hypothetical protein BN341_19580 [Helicobacter heilmannii ASB1.4]|nr:hypothetical protein BN341_19580 [Helicobacter heilmannii ASB1.4]